jgi:hypothetical protein
MAGCSQCVQAEMRVTRRVYGTYIPKEGETVSNLLSKGPSARTEGKIEVAQILTQKNDRHAEYTQGRRSPDRV